MKTKLSWQTISKKVSDLIPQEINPRKISEQQLSKLKASIEKYDLVEIPAIDLDGTILAGHKRIQVLKILGRNDKEIDVRIPNRKLTEEESKQYLIGSNKLGGEFDFELLKDFDFDLLLDSGFDESELNEFWEAEKEALDDDFDFEKELKEIKKPITKPGDIIIDSFLGSGSTLLCAEQLDRRVYACELEPTFCDLIIKRYENLTGNIAIIEHEEK